MHKQKAAALVTIFHFDHEFPVKPVGFVTSTELNKAELTFLFIWFWCNYSCSKEVFEFLSSWKPSVWFLALLFNGGCSPIELEYREGD